MSSILGTQTSSTVRRRVLVVLAVLLVALLALLLSRPAFGDAQRKANMAGLFASMKVLLPVAAREAGFAGAEKEPAVQAALDTLERNADVLMAHTKQEGPDTGLLGRSLSHDARELARRVRHQRYDAARFLLMEMTDYCIACHARLPAEVDSPLSEHFFTDSDLMALPLYERARLQVATRRFSDGLTSYEQLFQDPSVPVVRLLPALTAYLTTSIRVRRDLSRPAPVLEKFLQRKDLWRSLRSDVEQWVLSLAQLKRDLQKPPDLARARQMINDAHSLVEFRADRSPLVHYIVASAILHRLVEEKRVQGSELAEAYFLLGVAESHIREDYWIEQAEAYLEAAIRTDPGSELAERAYARLEEELILTHTGSAGMPLPEDVERRLQELERLIVSAQKAKPKPKPKPAR